MSTSTGEREHRHPFDEPTLTVVVGGMGAGKTSEAIRLAKVTAITRSVMTVGCVLDRERHPNGDLTDETGKDGKVVSCNVLRTTRRDDHGRRPVSETLRHRRDR